MSNCMKVSSNRGVDLALKAELKLIKIELLVNRVVKLESSALEHFKSGNVDKFITDQKECISLINTLSSQLDANDPFRTRLNSILEGFSSIVQKTQSVLFSSSSSSSEMNVDNKQLIRYMDDCLSQISFVHEQAMFREKGCLIASDNKNKFQNAHNNFLRSLERFYDTLKVTNPKHQLLECITNAIELAKKGLLISNTYKNIKDVISKCSL